MSVYNHPVCPLKHWTFSEYRSMFTVIQPLS